MDRFIHSPDLASLPPSVLLHLAAAAAALVLGPLVLSVRKGSRLHRAGGYAWVTLMLAAAVSSLFIRSALPLQLAGFSPIHLLSLLTLAGLATALVAIARRNVAAHRKAMWQTYVAGCIGAGAFALLPGRYLGDLLWHHGLGLV